jgi:hypothetical protein
MCVLCVVCCVLCVVCCVLCVVRCALELHRFRRTSFEKLRAIDESANWGSYCSSNTIADSSTIQYSSQFILEIATAVQ